MYGETYIDKYNPREIILRILRELDSCLATET